MTRSKWLGGSKDENPETADQAGETNPHNEAAAQRPGDGSASGESLPVSQINQGLTTTTTPDSQRSEQTEGQPVGELDQQSPEERLKSLRGWRSRNRLGAVSSAEWETFDQIVGDDDNEAAEPGKVVRSGEDRRP